MDGNADPAAHAIGDPVSPRGYRIIDRAAAERRFAVFTDVVAGQTAYAKPSYDQPVRLYENGLHLQRDFDLSGLADNIVVVGDLTVGGTLHWASEDRYRFVLVTGDLRVGAVELGQRAELVVRGDVYAAGHVVAVSLGESPFDADTRVAARHVRARCLVVHGHVDVVVAGDLTLTEAAWCQDEDDRGSLTVAGSTAVPVLCKTPDFGTTLCGHRTIGRFENVNVRYPDPDRLTLLATDVFSEHHEDYGTDYLREVHERILDAVLGGRPVLAEATGAEVDDPTAIRRVSLSGVDLSTGQLPDGGTLGAFLADLAGHGTVTELDLSGCDLTELPDTVGRLTSLRLLDISDNRLQSLPDSLGDLRNLWVLRAEGLRCPLPATVAHLDALEELILRRWRPDGGGAPFPFPAVTRLSRLRLLDLAGAALAEVPEDLLDVTTLELLDLGGALGHTTRLPDLSRLPALTVLRLSGDGGYGSTYPDADVIAGRWSVATLTELGLDRWRAEPGRPALVELPDDAFAGMPGLRALDLSFNVFETLPESFYSLTNLAEVDLQHTRLDRNTVDRLLATFPNAAINLYSVETAKEHPVWQRFCELVALATAQLATDRPRAIGLLTEAVGPATGGVNFGGTDQRNALCALVDALDRSHADASDSQKPALSDRILHYGRRAIELIPPGIYLPDGEVRRHVLAACDALARHLAQHGELDEALSILDRIGVQDAANDADLEPIRRTQVDILLWLDRPDDAYTIAHRALAHAPDSPNFADLAADPDLRSWRLAHRAATGFVRPRGRRQDRKIERIESGRTDITDLDLAETPLLPADTVLSLPSLRRLSLAGIDLSDGRLPDGTTVRALFAALGDRGTLEELDLSYARLPELPDTLGRLTSLRALDISGTTVTTVPPQIAALTELTRVTAHRLPGAVPAGLHHLPVLADLDLRRLGRPYFGDGRTPFHLPEPLMRMPTLRRLRLFGARIASMASGGNAIETLELSGGLLQADRLPDLSGMANLRILDLSANDLTGLPDDIFAGTPRLRRLDLRDNQLTTLPGSLFALSDLDNVRIDFAQLEPATLRHLAGLARTEPENPAHDWIRAVIVHLQLKTGRTADAHATVARILARRPDFAALADLACA
ncbi:leucine-rich repeat domain-containing protein [Virgisporangium aurantiacum]|uniref:leucine-rich repeat domain-containing protein n=1 Tax=Virgisporangium aurantiacum TaxID=175570 RepID=UPI00194E2A86|nr:leucine-rich repeat domain-containing protein [Virgisporangium aurantiacum]